MLIGRVIGNVVATQKNQRYEGTRAMLCRQITPHGEDMDYTCIALDAVSAGEGDIVIIAQEGWSASTAGELTGKPVLLGDKTPADLAKMKGQLKGAIVFSQPLQTYFERADRKQPTLFDEPVTIGQPRAPAGSQSMITSSAPLAIPQPATLPYCTGSPVPASGPTRPLFLARYAGSLRH